MPEFILPIASAETAREFNSLDTFTQGYLTALFWTEEEHLTEEGCANAGPADMRPSFLADCIGDCAKFQSDNAADLKLAQERGRDLDHCGHDFWLNRNGHGTGFWDRKELEADGLGERLSDACKRFSVVDVGLDEEGRVCR
jgi:hypothetical protein